MTTAYATRVATAGDLVGILTLQETMTQVVHWSEGLWLHLLTETPEGMPLRRVWVAEAEGKITGFLVLGGAAGIAAMEMVVVAAVERGKGIGRALCVEAMRWALQRGAASMELEVRASNMAAQRLYESLGFTRQGVRKKYYRDPVEDAVLMATRLRTRELQIRKV